ncbi:MULTISPECIES: hypothetical protein [Salinibaculum]|uniref:hypothetical protein n=1 Tax=Salinibaculum TaxID=2732368 RepID=UPI0030D265BA
MVDTDILLEQDRITVVGPPRGQSAGADVAVTTDPDDDPNITLNPDVADATFGGGSGQVPEGKLRVDDETGTSRVEITAPGQTRRERGERSEFVVRDDDGNRRVELTSASRESDRGESELVVSDSRENPRVQVSARRGEKRDPGENGVWINGQDGIVQLGQAQGDGTARPWIELRGNTGILDLNSDPQFRDDFAIRLDPRSADITAGGNSSDPSPGGIKLLDREGDETVLVAAESEGAGAKSRLRLSERGLGGVDLHTLASETNDPSAGVATFYNGDNYDAVEVRGDQAALRLGYSVPGGQSEVPTESVGNTSTTFAPGSGASGKILLDDGNAGVLAGGTVFRVEATEGTLEISSTGSRSPFFVIDPDDKSIKTPGDWTFDDL